MQTLAEYMQELMDDPTLALVPPDFRKSKQFWDRVESVFDCGEPDTPNPQRGD